MDKFLVDIIKEGRNAVITIPFNAKEIYNKPKGTIYVCGTLNEINYRCKLVSKGNDTQIMIIDKKMKTALGFNGDILKNVKMLIEQDHISIINVDTGDKHVKPKPKTIDDILERVSVRAFTDQEVSDEDLNMILDAGFSGPSARNRRPWHFIVIRDKKKLSDMAQYNPNVGMAKQASVCIIICGDQCVQGTNEFLIEDCSAATQNILLAAHALGLGGVWCGVAMKSDWYKYLIDTLQLPTKIIPISVIPIGYSAENRTATNKWEPNKIHKEVW